MLKNNILKISHDWTLPSSEAIQLQQKLAQKVICESQDTPIKTIAGVDAHYHEGIARAAIVVLEYPALNVISYAISSCAVDYEYVPGLLSFREGPAVLAAYEKLSQPPDLMIFDGHGFAHPRRLGLASHIGVILDIPTIGCAKKRLCGNAEEPGEKRGDFSYLTENGSVLGAVLRTQTNVRPVFVSIGHRIDLSSSIQYVLTCSPRYRLPETTRWSHRIAGGELPPPV